MDQPYFYFHEYKRSRKNREPISQILIAMLISQEKNSEKHPLYGCAIVGEFWYFIDLDDKNYSVSIPYVSSSVEGLQNIVLILRKFKLVSLTELVV